MNVSQYEKLFRSKASRLGFSEDEVVSCLEYAFPLIKQKLPVIYNTANLAALVGYRTTYLKRAAKYTAYYYRVFTIKKSNGKMRSLAEPLPSLKEIQTWILENILQEVKVSRYAKAYIKNKTLLENVKYHKNRELVLTLDIKDFFGSINVYQVEQIFLNLGYSSNISNLLSKICTNNEALPQGAPTSPYLSNIYLKNFDEIVAKFCIDNDIRYTRYADDMTFSGQMDSDQLTEFVKKELQELKLVLNASKTKLMAKEQRQIVTGVVVNKVIQIPKSDRNFIRNEVYYLLKFGLVEHLERTNNKRANYLAHLLGKINFALHINKDDKKMNAYKKDVLSFIAEEE